MPAATWAALLATWAVAVVVPGPDTFLLLRLGVRERRAAVLAAVGIMIGNLIWTGASVLGLAALMRTLPGALPLMQLLGSSVLVWIGVQSIRGGLRGLRARRTASEAEAGEVAAAVTRHPLRLGFITNISNPKALLFYTALFSQLMPLEATAFDRTMIVVVLTVLGLGFFIAFALLASSRAFQRWLGRATPFIDIAAGVVFLLVAGFVLGELIVALIGGGIF